MKLIDGVKVYGDTGYRGACPAETAEQVTFFAELKRLWPDVAAVAIHPRNEGKRSFYQAAKHKAEGMVKGASDVIIPGCPALVIEIKRLDHTKSRWEDGQPEYLEAAKALGATVCVALGYKAALEAVEEWHTKSK